MEYDKGLENDLIQQNMGLVVSQALKYLTHPVVDIDDYIQVGSLALLKAIRSYNPERGKLGTYAWSAIHNAIMHEARKFSNHSKPLRDMFQDTSIISIWELVPDSLTQQEEEVLEYRLQNMSLSEIAKEMGYSKEWINQLLNSAINKMKKANDT